MRTVHEVSRLTGVSIRALQYYDRIGLLRPSAYSRAGYRLYDDTALETLQQILLYRELDFPLVDIKALLSERGIGCDILKLTKIFPVPHDVIGEIKQYRRIVFFEEAERMGGISAMFGDLLMEQRYSGDYSRVTAEGFIKQASVKSALAKLGLTAEKMADYVCRRSLEDGKA